PLTPTSWQSKQPHGRIGTTEIFDNRCCRIGTAVINDQQLIRPFVLSTILGDLKEVREDATSLVMSWYHD
ncbi:MAG TPA: hypothetical protein VFQ02_09215, partial [Nitrospira sp.]|nr:hypothetical protein [Nitrospira sp.]